MNQNRKDEHVALANCQQQHAIKNDFDDLDFIHHALAGIDADQIKLETNFAGTDWKKPIYINGMTGGTQKTGVINRELAIAARQTGIAMASGSMSIYLKDPAVADSFTVIRAENPDGFVLANLNATASADQANRVIELLQANALQIHLNTIQETVMPEGDRSFGNWRKNIEKIVAAVPVPVVVKEVGFGLSLKTIAALNDLGVRVADVSGNGGTNFALIENSRRGADDFSYLANWGQSTALSLLTGKSFSGRITLAASGGIRNPLDVVKALALGATAVGVSGNFLKTVLLSGAAGLVDKLEIWCQQIAQLMTVLGAPDIAKLQTTDLFITGKLAERAKLVGVNLEHYASRNKLYF